MLCLGGLLALDITTTTPDALCPPLAEVRAAVEQRVGEVRGDYEARFTLIRGEGGRVLELVLLERDRQVLRRELTLGEAECQDAAQTIALVLERYFDAVERPVDPEPAPILGPPTEPVAAAPKAVQAPAPATPSAPAEPVLRTHAGLAYDWELGLAPLLGAALFPRAWRLTPTMAVGTAIDLGFYITQKNETVREERIRAATVRAALYVPLTWRLGSWSTWLGPWGQLSLQRANAESLPNGREAYRALPGMGGFGRLGWAFAPAWTLAATAAGGGQMVSSGARLVLQRSDGTRNAVLVPATWFGQAQLTLGTTL